MFTPGPDGTPSSDDQQAISLPVRTRPAGRRAVAGAREPAREQSGARSRDEYAEMAPLLEELHREDDPARRAIGGTSSGAIAAFTVAWHRPDVFGNVISFIGSYVSIGYRPAQDGVPMVPGGDLYPGMIRKSGIRPLRIFLQDGSNDLDNEHGNWFLANQQMLAALRWANAQADRDGSDGARYALAHVWGEGGHSDDHGGQLLPDVLRWLWQPGAPAPGGATD